MDLNCTSCFVHRWLLREENVCSKVLWTDESCFTNNKMCNKKLVSHWAQENPRLVYEVDRQRRFSVNVWCGVIGGRLVGPIFYEGTLDANRYLDFLNNEISELLGDLPLALRAQMYYHHDGAPPHNGRNVVAFMNNEYPGRWLGTNGPIPWPARSPDLNPLDFFVWGHVKNRVYTFQPPNTINELRNRIRNAFAEIDGRQVRRATNSVRTRARTCVEKGGLHFEQFL